MRATPTAERIPRFRAQNRNPAMTPAKTTIPAVNGWNAEYVDEMYEQWQRDPNAVEPSLRTFFEGFDLGYRPSVNPDDDGAGGASRDTSHGLPAGVPAPAHGSLVAHTPQGRVDSLIYHYRDNGHAAAQIDPLGRDRARPAVLELESYGLDESQLDEMFDPGHLPLDGPSPLRTIIDVLDATYCGHVGVEYMHIQDREQRRWLQQSMESVRNTPEFSTHERRGIMRELTAAEAFENFLHTRYQGKKRFGIDGGESVIPLLHELVERGPESGVQEYTIAMAHRGRLNVLVNLLKKSYDQIFTEFDESWVEDFTEGGGDVKYHRGYSSSFQTESGELVRLSLSPNPSHLEFANSVVLGRARAKQRLRHDEDRSRCVPVLIHGDAAFPGQGVVAECFNMMMLDGYHVGGAVHVIINNQIGFTTNPSDAHSGTYCTDLAKSVEAPIFHVNGDDPEACVWAARMALAYRQKFRRDVVIDMWCYRRFGHNEGDEPTYTQPVMYKIIKQKTSVAKQYGARLVDANAISKDDLDGFFEEAKKRLDAAQTRARETPADGKVRAFQNVWAGLVEEYSDGPIDTAVPRDRLDAVAKTLGVVPDGFNAHRKLKKLLEGRANAMGDGAKLDWGAAEMLAYGSLLMDGHAVRLTGQDVERGTFSHRHAVMFDQESAEPYTPLLHLPGEHEKFCVHNSPLTEAACLGFEYGYSLADPRMLVIWEAQFGDFANGAQVIFDQFISSAEAKWQRSTGLVCLLPHGYEGQGPEHSSARLERFLTLCAKDNMQVVNPTTPAQIFHLLRRQMLRDFRKPLIVMSPKSLLRLPAATSTPDELTDGRFQHFIPDPQVDPANAKRVVFCSGKVAYDLMAARATQDRMDTAIVRVEQLFPFNDELFRNVIDSFSSINEFVWCQEEPRNMGAWTYIDALMRERFDLSFRYVGRVANSTPAGASTKMHQTEQELLVQNALELEASLVPESREQLIDEARGNISIR